MSKITGAKTGAPMQEHNIAAATSLNIFRVFRLNSSFGFRARSIRSQNAVQFPCDILFESMPGNVRSTTEEVASCLKSILQLMMDFAGVLLAVVVVDV